MSLPTTLLRCPACGTVFRGPAVLPAHGKVRCGVCSEVFGAQAQTADNRAAPFAADRPRPAYASPAVAAATPARRRVYAVLALLLLLTLLAQLAWLGRNRLAASPLLRPVMDAACGVLGCRLPPFRDLGAIHFGEARVTSHPDYAGALLAVVTLDNSARLGQPWPRLALALTGADDAAVAERTFAPAEYLPADRQSDALFVAGGSVEVRLPLADPGTQAAGFRFAVY